MKIISVLFLLFQNKSMINLQKQFYSHFWTVYSNSFID